MGTPAERLDDGVCTLRDGRRLTPVQIAAWSRPEDVAQLTDELDLESFGVVGLSMGGPHALAVGAAQPTVGGAGRHRTRAREASTRRTVSAVGGIGPLPGLDHPQ